jgi:hypothetical protein
MAIDAITRRLLDPTPLTDEEIEEQVDSCLLNDAETFINFHHPFYVGMYIQEVEESPPDSTLREHFDLALVRPRIKAKHEYIHDHDAIQQTLMMFERPYRPIAAEIMLIENELGYHMPRNELRSLVMSLWTDTEFPSRNMSWISIFEQFRDELEPPFGDLDLLGANGMTTVYRGVSAGPGDPIEGLSWTTSQATAQWFSRRFHDPGKEPQLLMGTVANDGIWFATNDRNESEIVSDAVRILEVRNLGITPHPDDAHWRRT